MLLVLCLSSSGRGPDGGSTAAGPQLRVGSVNGGGRVGLLLCLRLLRLLLASGLRQR